MDASTKSEIEYEKREYLLPIDDELICPEKYIQRIRSILPNFPIEVISQWFFDHHHQARSEYSWLDFDGITFTKILIKTEGIPVIGIGNDSCIAAYSDNFASGRSAGQPRMRRLADYFLANGTWPVPPIFIENGKGLMKFDNGWPCGKPLHLIEGHNRIAQFIHFRATRTPMNEQHHIFLARLENGN